MPASWNFIKPPPWEQVQWSETHIQLTWAHQFLVKEASTFCKSFSSLQKLYCIFNVHVTFSFWRRNGYEPKTSCGSFWRWLPWGSLQLQTGEWRWSQFSARLEERTDGGTQHRLGKLSESRECLLPGVPISWKNYKGIYFLCRQFFFWPYTWSTWHYIENIGKYKSDPKVYSPGGRERKRIFHWFFEWN